MSEKVKLVISEGLAEELLAFLTQVAAGVNNAALGSRAQVLEEELQSEIDEWNQS